MRIDAKGLECPKPVVMALKELPSLAAGEILEVEVDNEAAVENLTRMAENQGCAAAVQTEGTISIVQIVKGAQEVHTETPPECAVPVQHSGMREVIAIGTNEMGQGDPKLGQILMKAYLYALTQQDILPNRILFFNGGAKLTIKSSESLADIQNLESRGVEIFTCGTCLDFYGIKDQLAVGNVTNMYEIAESMQKAAKVVRI